MDLANVERELSAIRDGGRVRRIVFVDDTFNVPVARFRAMLSLLQRFSFEWYAFLRVQYVTDELAALMRASGCRGVYLGLESANDEAYLNDQGFSMEQIKTVQRQINAWMLREIDGDFSKQAADVEELRRVILPVVSAKG